MAVKQYQWRAVTDYESDTDLSHGVTPSTQETWQTENVGESLTKTYTYWYRDSNTANQYGQYTDAISSKVTMPVTQTWTVTADDHNVITVTITTEVGDIWRTDLNGVDQDLPGRDIDLYARSGSSWTLKWADTDNQVATQHQIATGPLDFGTTTFTIAPGNSEVHISSVRVHNETVGYSSYDNIGIGIQFRNTLPPDYRPGKNWSGSDWLSHDRTGGWAGVWDGSAFKEMRTVDGPDASGDPPTIKHSDGWKNQRKIGTE